MAQEMRVCPAAGSPRRTLCKIRSQISNTGLAVGKDRSLDDPQKMLVFGRDIFFHRGVVPQKRKTAQISPESSGQRPEQTERGQWLIILEAAAGRPSDELDEDWMWLIDQLGVPYEYLPAMVEAIAFASLGRTSDSRPLAQRPGSSLRI